MKHEKESKKYGEEIPLAYIQDLYLDLPERMKELVENKGGPISH